MSQNADLKHVLLDLISTARPVTAARLAALSDADWLVICTVVKQHRIAPMLHHRLQILELSEFVPPHVRAQWSGAYRKAAYRYLSCRKTLARIAAILGSADIAFAALKGAWLSQFAYSDPALRPLRDIDILVEPDTALAVYALLEKNGFIRRDDFPMPLDGAMDYAKHLPPMRCADTGIYLEVHTRLMDVPPAPSATRTLNDITQLLARCEHRDRVPYLSPTDTLLHLIIHAAYDHQFNNGPLTFNDIAFLLKATPVDWPAFWTMARAGNWVRGCVLILELAAFYHCAEQWRESYNETVAPPTTGQLENAALLSLQDFDQRGLIGFKAAFADDTTQFGKARSLWNRAFPPLHRLAAFSGAPTASHWSLLHYPRWILAQIHRLFVAKDDAAMMADVDRARDVRNWMYKDSVSRSAFDK